MNAHSFIDTNVLNYAFDEAEGLRYAKSRELIE
jgi:predicted nucleic acid-binding protein